MELRTCLICGTILTLSLSIFGKYIYKCKKCGCEYPDKPAEEVYQLPQWPDGGTTLSGTVTSNVTGSLLELGTNEFSYKI